MHKEDQTPIIIGFVSDLMFSTRISSVAKHLGFRVRWVEHEQTFGDPATETDKPRPGEALDGPTGNMLLEVVRVQPALVLFDLANSQIPWRRWIAVLKSAPASSRTPVICFGPHVNVEIMNAAKEAGADLVLARSRFAAAMPQILQQHARMPDHALLRSECDQPLSVKARHGIMLHNQGDYYAAHEALEEAWMADKGAGRDLYRGLLQISVAFLQIERGNYRGALKMCLRVRQWLTPLPNVCRGVDVSAAREIVESTHDMLLELGPGRIDQFDRALLRPFTLSA
jgi:predicted metal-dependent hydrolase